MTVPLATYLERVPAYAGLSSDRRSWLAAAAVTRTLARGDRLWGSGDSSTTFTVVRSGLIKITREGPGGRCIICGMFGPGESVGDLAALKGVPYPASAIVATDEATVVQLRREAVLDVLRRDPGAALAMAGSAQSKVMFLHGKIDVLSAGSIEGRLATLLTDLHERFGDEFEGGEQRLPLALSRRELAELVGTTLETAIRVMSRWQRDGLVDTVDDGFVLRDLPRLRGLRAA